MIAMLQTLPTRRKRTPFVFSFIRQISSAAVISAASLAFGLVATSASAAGLADVPLPAVMTHPLQPQDMVQKLLLPSLDIDALLKEDTVRPFEEPPLPPRYAIPNQVKITTNDAGMWEAMDRNNSVWRLRISSPGAVSLNFGITDFHLPEGGRLFLYSADMRMVIRPFTAADNSELGELWTPPVAGEEAVIELVVPNHARRDVRFTIGSINIGYREFALPANVRKNDDGGLASGSCNVDVVCPEAAGWEDQIQSVGVISTGGSTFCTGYMVNNTAQDRTPFFMTANHCGVNSGNAASLVVFWNYQNSWCRPIGSAASGSAGDGSLGTFSTGSTFRASSSASDFTLVQLVANPDPAWGVTYAGWDRTPGEYNPPSGACIHHPSTDEKRIAFYDIAVRPDRPSHGSSWPCSTFPGPGANTHIRVYWSLGVTEPGSSGSPLFDNNRRVIGQLHGGPAACGSTGDSMSDCYGRFSVSWTGGGTSSTRLSDWLDPSNTGAMNVDTLGRGLSISPSGTVMHIGVVGGPFNPASTPYVVSNTSGLSANYNISIVGGGSAPISLNGGAGPLSGSIPNNGTFNFTVAPTAAALSLTAGVYSTDVLIQDTTNNISYTQTHIVEVGQIGYTTSPATGLSTGGPNGGPFSATQMYAITSTRPTPVTVVVTASEPWISINGGSGPVNIDLNSEGASANVTIGISAAANSLANGLYNGTVSFNAQSGGTASNTTRNVALDVGRYTYVATGLPLPILDNTTIFSTIEVTDNYCVGDVDLPINITHTFRGDLIVEITSPAGTIVRLHNRTGGSADDIITTYDDDGAGTLPDGPGSLALFEGESVQGTWTLRVSDLASADTGALNAWSLKIASQPICLQRVVVYDFPMDVNPGWNAQPDWAFGVPTPAGGNPGSGATGSNVYGYNLAGAYPNNLAPPRYLTTTALNMTGKTGTQLKFQRWLGVESSTWDHANIQVSTNGSTWTTIWENPTSTFQDTAWSTQLFDISAIADDKPTVYIRWGMGTTDGSVTRSGWNIDDVQILAFVPLCEGDINGDGIVNVTDLLAVIGAWGPCPSCPPTPCAADIAGNDCIVNVSDLLMVIGNWGGCP